jgi:ABC-type multidrug transport system fused ATPase/permease subunit
VGALAVLAWVRRSGVPHLQAERACRAGFWGYAGEVLGAREDLRASGASGYVRRRTLDHLRGWLPAAVRAQVWGSSMWWVCTGVGVVVYTLTYGLGAHRILGGRMTLGTLLMLIAYLDKLLWGPLASLSNEMQALQTAEVSITRVRALLQTSSRLCDGSALLPEGAPSVEFRDVRFAYPRASASGTSPGADTSSEADASAALDGVSFHLPAGRTLGLLGRTGSGKTTLGRLLYRFYDPQQGQVRLGGVDLRQARLASLRARVGLVTQDVQLLAGTLRDNLSFYDPRFSDARLLEALEALGLARWLARFPAGLDTPLSKATLSAGEAQLVALTRVYLKDPGLIVLDEASSRLDPATEALLGRALDHLLAGRTALIIAHRLSTLARVDQVLILEKGRVVECGARAALAADPRSRLSALLRTGLEEAAS